MDLEEFERYLWGHVATMLERIGMWLRWEAEGDVLDLVVSKSAEEVAGRTATR